jgi:hypothetical protein
MRFGNKIDELEKMAGGIRLSFLTGVIQKWNQTFFSYRRDSKIVQKSYLILNRQTVFLFVSEVKYGNL